MAAQKSRKFIFVSALLVGIPLALLVLPLFFHNSLTPAVGTYSVAYTKFLVAAVLMSICVVAGTSWLCYRRQTIFPAIYLDFLVGLGIVAFFLTEIILHRTLTTLDPFDEFRAWGHRRAPFFGFEAAPNNSWGSNGMFTTDEFGFRTHKNNTWKDSTGPRIFTLGESSTFGFGLADDQTWTHLLENNLRSRFSRQDVNIINAGNNAFNALQALLKFQLRVRHHKPKTVIFYAARNDVYEGIAQPDNSHFYRNSVFTAPSVASLWNAATKGRNIYWRSLTAYFLLQRVRVFRKLQWGQETIDSHSHDGFRMPTYGFNPQPRSTTALPPELKRITDDLLERREAWTDVMIQNAENLFMVHVDGLCALAQAAGVRVILTTFLQNFGTHHPHGITVRVYNYYIRQYAARKNIPLVDLERQFDSVPEKEKYFFSDHYHPSLQGAEFIARELAAAWQPEWFDPLPAPQ